MRACDLNVCGMLFEVASLLIALDALKIGVLQRETLKLQIQIYRKSELIWALGFVIREQISYWSGVKRSPTF